MLDKIKIIHNENALKAVIYNEKDENIQKLLIEYMSYMHSDSSLFLSKIFIFIKNNDISPWVRGEVAESLLKLDLPNNDGISEILKDVICNKSINSKTKSDIAKRIFTFRKDKEFTQEIIAIINNESMSSWVRGALVSALPSFDKVKNVELIFDFMFNSQINHLVKEDIARDIMPMLLQFKEYHERVFMSIIDITTL